jgi:hypothetical protein
VKALCASNENSFGLSGVLGGIPNFFIFDHSQKKEPIHFNELALFL